MPSFRIELESGTLSLMKNYQFRSEGSDKISPQSLIEKYPQIILSIGEIDIPNYESIICAREFNTSRGPIDLLFLTSNADMIILETKLLRNPESQRTVVAQIIDYAKAVYSYNTQDFINQLNKNIWVDKTILSTFRDDDNWSATLGKNISTGNFQIIVVGDKIHPNVLGMVESIQAAPHMAFTVYLVELEPYLDDNQAIVISPRVVSKTLEVERSVIRIEIDYTRKTHKLDSELPDIKGKGSKPIISQEQFLNNLNKAEFQSPIKQFWKNWQEIGGDIRMGTVGFSAYAKFGDKRIPLFYVLDKIIGKISENTKNSYGIPDEIYQKYKNDLKNYQDVYDRYVIGNKVDIPFDDIDLNTLNGLFQAAINLVNNMRPK
jgi:hypothetical protein